jgi:hypothetical protein
VWYACVSTWSPPTLNDHHFEHPLRTLSVSLDATMGFIIFVTIFIFPPRLPSTPSVQPSKVWTSCPWCEYTLLPGAIYRVMIIKRIWWALGGSIKCTCLPIMFGCNNGRTEEEGHHPSTLSIFSPVVSSISVFGLLGGDIIMSHQAVSLCLPMSRCNNRRTEEEGHHPTLHVFYLFIYLNLLASHSRRCYC